MTAGLVAIGILASSGGSAVARSAAATPACSSSLSTHSPGVVSSFCFQPAATGAGSAQTLNTAITFDYGKGSDDTVKDIAVTLPPGLLAIPTAVPAICTMAELQSESCPSASQVGTGTVTADDPQLPLLAIPATATMYAMAVPTADAATDVAYFGLDIMLRSVPKPGASPLVAATAGASIATVGGQPAVQFAFAGLPNHLPLGTNGSLPLQVTALTLWIDGTLDSGAAYTRLPTSCAPAVTTLSVDTYAGADGGGTDQFTPTDCASLPFSPAVSVSAAKDAGDLGVQFSSTITQPAGQAAQQALTLAVPAATLGPDLVAAAGDFGTIVGTATADTPILPKPLTGTVTLGGTVSAPQLTITFPPPVPLTLTGSVDLIGNSVTFSGLPDVPLSSLNVTLFGGASALYGSICTQPSGSVEASMTGQNGASASVSAPFTISNCTALTPSVGTPVSTASTTTPPASPPATPPTSSSGKKKQTPAKVSKGSLSGLASGAAVLRFTLTAGSAKLTAFTVSLPSGLSFASKALRKGVSVSGGRVKSLRLSGGALVVTLRSGASRLTVRASASALNERTALQGKVRARKVKTLVVSIVANGAGQRTALHLKLRV